VTPYQPTLHCLPDDTRGRFKVLREFLSRWHGLDTGTVGRTVPRVREAAARVRKRLPLGVREWIVLLDDLDRIGGWGLVLRDCWSLGQVPDCPAFSLLVQGEDDHHWGPMFRDLDREDPPTCDFLVDYDRDPVRFRRNRQVAPRASTWAVEFILSNLRLSRSAELERTISRPALDRLRRRPPPGVIASRVGQTVLFEFEGGLLHTRPEGKTAGRLFCYSPYPADADHQAVTSALERRVREILART
jgi:hypothetical protein